MARPTSGAPCRVQQLLQSRAPSLSSVRPQPRYSKIQASKIQADQAAIAGLFLRDLATNAELPTFLDPTAPNASAAVNSAGSLTAVADPSAFADFPPLPPDTSLAPLVNVHKFRVLAQTVQRVLAFQELASRYAFEPTPKVYFKCLKIRCLEQSVMRELSTRLEA